MTTIRTTCPRCGEVEVSAEAVLLHVLRGDSEGIYSFICPACREDVEKRTNRKIIALLVSAGVGIEDRSGHPSNVRFDEIEPDPRGALPAGPAFTLDDLIDFHFLLEDDRYVKESSSRAHLLRPDVDLPMGPSRAVSRCR
jgi:predicted RNA-binding Zn-ribbon protein involved in translation (DUF1610 family)